MELLCEVQKYSWGKVGSDSKVAQLCGNVNKNFKVDENSPYAELWMGTHINGPSVVKCTGKKLDALIQEHPEYLGSEVIKNFGKQLPFLFKVLSIRTALSIQAHPNKKHAEELHAKYPNIYKDPNHKPELAIALTPFEALCGFRPVEEIKNYLKNIPELNKIVKWDEISTKLNNDCDILKSSFRSVFTTDKKVITECMESYIKRLQLLSRSERLYLLADLVEKLNSQYPNDVGIFMVYFLNYLQLQPGQAIYLGANEPHAYISGDCIECMACSDNVVRAGLTPKLIDVETLCGMLNYSGAKAEEKLFAPVIEDKYSKVFQPPVADFAVAEIKIPASTKTYTTPVRKSASIFIVISGCGNANNIPVVPGTTIFVAAEDSIVFTEIKEDFVMYQAFANV